MKPIKLITGGIFTLVAIIVFMMTYFQVEQNERTVVTRFGQISYVATPGLHFKVPFVYSTVDYKINIKEVKPAKAVNTFTIDNQEVDVAFSVFYQLPPDKIAFIYENVPDYETRLLTMTVDRLKSEMGKVNVTVVAEKRGELRDNILKILKADAMSLGLNVTEFLLVDMEYNKTFRDAVNNAAVEKAKIEQRDYEKKQAVVTADRALIDAEGLANAARAKARGDADARILAATAEAKAIQMQGEAQAAAILAQAKALDQNSNYVALRQAERWNGALPQWTAGNGPMPILNVAPPAPQRTYDVR